MTDIPPPHLSPPTKKFVENATHAAVIEAKRAARKTGAWVVVIAAGVLSGGSAMGWQVLLDKAETKGAEQGKLAADAGIAKVQEVLSKVTQEQEIAKARLAIVEQVQVQQRDEQYQARLEVQAVYRAIMDGQRQPRLEKPIPAPAPAVKDGGI